MTKIKILLLLSLFTNFILLVILAIYQFSPAFDYAVVTKSLPRLCDYAKNKVPEAYPNFPVCQYVHNTTINNSQ